MVQDLAEDPLVKSIAFPAPRAICPYCKMPHPPSSPFILYTLSPFILQKELNSVSFHPTHCHELK
nr:hypothetical protein Q903MT_gene2602 [Picea sitchensis]